MSDQASAATRPVVGYLLLPCPAEGEPPPDLARCCDLLGEHAPTVEPDPARGAWFALRDGKRAKPPEASGAALLAALASRGYPDVRLAFAPTAGVARLAAGIGAGPLTIVAPAGLADFLAPVRVGALGLDRETRDRLGLLGLHTLGAIAALPRGALGDHLGPLGAAVEALARGADARPLLPRRPALVLRARRALDWPLASADALAALLGRLVAPLLARLGREGLGATRVALGLRVAARVVRVVADLPTPTVAAPIVVAALLGAAERALGAVLAREAAGDEGGGAAGITAVVLTLTAPRPLPVRQLSFFDVPQGRAALVLAGLAAARRRGDGAVGYLRPVEPDHPRPERRYALDAEALPPEAAS